MKTAPTSPAKAYERIDLEEIPEYRRFYPIDPSYAPVVPRRSSLWGLLPAALRPTPPSPTYMPTMVPPAIVERWVPTGPPVPRYVPQNITLAPARLGDAAPRSLRTAHFAAAAAAVTAVHRFQAPAPPGGHMLRDLLEAVLSVNPNRTLCHVTLFAPSPNSAGELQPHGVTVATDLYRTAQGQVTARTVGPRFAGTYALLEKAFCQIMDSGVDGFEFDPEDGDSRSNIQALAQALSALTGAPTRRSNPADITDWATRLQPQRCTAHVITLSASHGPLVLGKGDRALQLMPHLPYALAGVQGDKALLIDVLRSSPDPSWYAQRDLLDDEDPQDVSQYATPSLPNGLFAVSLAWLRQHGACLLSSTCVPDEALQHAVVGELVQATQGALDYAKPYLEHLTPAVDLLKTHTLTHQGRKVMLRDEHGQTVQCLHRHPLLGLFHVEGSKELQPLAQHLLTYANRTTSVVGGAAGQPLK